MLQFPVELRHHIIDPSEPSPLDAVGVERVVALQGIGAASVGVALDVSPHAERADTEAHPGLDGGDGVMQLLDEQVNIVPSPVAAFHSFAIGCVGGIVGEVNALNGIRIEIIVHVYSVHVVAGYDIGHHLADEIAALRQAGVEVDFAVGIGEEPLRVAVVDMAGSRHFAFRGGDAVGVDPRVKLHSAAVSFGNHKPERVPCRRRSHTRRAADVARPRLERAGIGGIGLRAYLPDDGVASGCLERVELVAQICLRLLRSHGRILALADDVHPGTAELALGGLRLRLGG